MATRYGGIPYLRSERERKRKWASEMCTRETIKEYLNEKIFSSTRFIDNTKFRHLSLACLFLSLSLILSHEDDDEKCILPAMGNRKRRIDENYYHKVASKMAVFWLERRDYLPRAGAVVNISSVVLVSLAFKCPRMRSRWDSGVDFRSSSSWSV